MIDNKGKEPVQSLSDDIVMRAVQNGRIELAGRLFEKYQKPLYNFFLKLTRDTSISQDMLQDTFLRVLKYRNRYQPGTNFRTWLYAIGRNLYRNHLKEMNRKITHLDDVTQLVDESPLPGVGVIRDEQLTILHSALNRLAPEKREIIILSRFQNLKYKEIAALVNMSESAVKVSIFRSLKELRTFYLKISDGDSL